MGLPGRAERYVARRDTLESAAYAGGMAQDLRTLKARLKHVQDRMTEASVRLRRDAELLADTQTALARLLEELLERPADPQLLSPRTQADRRMVRLAEVCRTVGLARSTIWKMVGDGRFPAPRRLGPRSVGWLSTDVDAWMSSRDSSDSCASVGRPTDSV